MKTKISEDKIDHLYEIILKLRSVEDCRMLFEDLCTIQEIEKMAERIEVAELLLEGKTYTEVMEKLEVSSATLSRVNKCVQYGEGYQKFLKK